EADAPGPADRQFLAVDIELLQRPRPVPGPAVHEVHDEQVLQLLNLSKAEAIRGGDGTGEVEVGADVVVPALHELTAQVCVGDLEVQHDIEPARPLESPVDELGSAVAGENEHHALIDTNAVQSAEEDRLILGFVNGLAIAQGQVHVIEEDDAAALAAEQF